MKKFLKRAVVLFLRVIIIVSIGGLMSVCSNEIYTDSIVIDKITFDSELDEYEIIVNKDTEDEAYYYIGLVAYRKIYMDDFIEQLDYNKSYDIVTWDGYIYGISDEEKTYLDYDEIEEEVKESIYEWKLVWIFGIVIPLILTICIDTDDTVKFISKKRWGLFTWFNKKFSTHIDIVVNDKNLILVKGDNKERMYVKSVGLSTMPITYNLYKTQEDAADYVESKNEKVQNLTFGRTYARIYVPKDYSAAERGVLEGFIVNGRVKDAEIINLEEYFKDRIVDGILLMANVRAVNVVCVKNSQITDSKFFDKFANVEGEFKAYINNLKQIRGIEDLYLYDPDGYLSQFNNQVKQIINI